MKYDPEGRRRLLPLSITLVCLLIPATASANGAMSLALATFAWGPWFAYVLVTILFEAVALGKWLHIPLVRSLKYSLIANFLTAVLGGLVSGFVCALLGFYGRQLNPNPLGQTLLLFTLFGCVSALIEASIWRDAVKNTRGNETSPSGAKPLPPSNVLTRCLVVHLIGVPVALAVLLLPPKPYPGLEGQVYSARLYYFQRVELKKALQVYIGEHQSLPPAASYGELLQLLKPRLDRFANDPDLWAAAYLPDYHRFDTTEKRRHPIEWNSKAAGFKLLDELKSPLWLVRSQHYGFCEGLVLDSGGRVKRTTGREALGYDSTKKSAKGFRAGSSRVDNE